MFYKKNKQTPMSTQATWDELPIEIQKKCLLRQKQLRGYQDVKAFKSSTYAGFSFKDSPEGGIFWVEVIGRSNFELFFQKYPKKNKPKKINNHESINSQIQNNRETVSRNSCSN